MTTLFDKFLLGNITLENRIVMAPMTRSRAKTHAPDDSTAIYYAQRATAGLIITEGTVVSQQARGYLWTPGIYNDEQLKGWKKVTEAVHQAGGKIFVQLWHVGRMSHTSLQESHQFPVSSVASQVSMNWPVFAYDEDNQPAQIQASPARELTVKEINLITEDFVQAARNAISVGFDGVELHGAGTYLFDQFINGGINTRSDEYGGNIENRIRLLIETTDAVAKEIGHDKVGVRISPEGRLHDGPSYSDERETFLKLAEALSVRNLAYVHINDLGISTELLREIRSKYQGVLMITGELTQEKAEHILKEGTVDLVGFGRLFIGNPDLVERFREGLPLTDAAHETYYGGDDHGYIDFPKWQK